MSYAASPPDHQKMDIIAVVRAAYAAVSENARLAIELAWLPFAILVLAELIAAFLDRGGLFGELLGLIVKLAGLIVFGTIFTVRWHRFMLLGQRESNVLFPPGWGEYFLAAVKVGLCAFAGVIVLMVIAALPPHFLTGLIALCGCIALAVASARVSLVFPAAAIERPMTLRQAWDAMPGNYWRLFVSMVVCYLPFGAVRFIVDIIGSMLPSILWLIAQAIGIAVSLAGIAVVTSLLSNIYRELDRPGSEQRAA